MKNMSFFVVVVSMVVVLALGACTSTRFVEVPTVKTDTLYIAKHERDSVWLHDSIHVKEKGDSVMVERWHVRYQEKVVHDTLHHYKVDSVAVPYPVEVKVEKELSWWQKTRIHMGEALLVVMGIALAWGMIALWRKFRT